MPNLEIKKKYEELKQWFLPDQSNNDDFDKLINIILHGPLLKLLLSIQAQIKSGIKKLKQVGASLKCHILCAEEEKRVICINL